MKKVAIAIAIVISALFVMAYVGDLTNAPNEKYPLPMHKVDYLNKINGHVSTILNRQQTNMVNVLEVMEGSMDRDEAISMMQNTIAHEDAMLKEVKKYSPPEAYKTTNTDLVHKVNDSKKTLNKCIEILKNEKKSDCKKVLDYLEIDCASVKTLHSTVS